MGTTTIERSEEKANNVGIRKGREKKAFRINPGVFLTAIAATFILQLFMETDPGKSIIPNSLSLPKAEQRN